MEKSKIITIGHVDLREIHLEKTDPDNLILLPVIDMVLFPGVTMPINLTRPESEAAVRFAYDNRLPIGVVCQTSSNSKYPTSLSEIHSTGVVCQVMNITTMFEQVATAFVRALPKQRFEIKSLVQDGSSSFLRASVTIKPDRTPHKNSDTYLNIVNKIRKEVKDMSSDSPELAMLAEAIGDLKEPAVLINTLATNLPVDVESKMSMLRMSSLLDRADALLELTIQGKELNQLMNEINDRARSALGESQRRMFLQQKYDELHDELYGDDDEISILKNKAEQADMPEQAQTIFGRELRKLERFNPQSPDYALLYTYLETLSELPWNKSTELNRDFSKAESILDTDHYGMEQVKSRILEQLAVAMHNNEVKSPILCLVGAPGVGKTSLGRSVARALGREYQRVSLGGTHDESEIRGHRRTYIGAMPGRIITAIQKAGVNNPLLLLDEIDKLCSDIKGDPAAALLEVLDPEQNCHFHDNYIDADFDLSNVFFIATANTLDTLPRPLLDRMEIIEMPGYLPEEKLHIARRHLIPGILAKYAMDPALCTFTDEAINYTIRHYTAESGVRQLEKKLAEVARKQLLAQQKGETPDSPITDHTVRKLLGLEIHVPDDNDTATPVGVVNGLAWTPIGGEVLQIEASKSTSKTPKLTLTGNLGDVMKESATIALQYVRAHADELGIDNAVFETADIHIHAPEGAVPKDGPSAGITITTALVSLLTGRKVKKGVAMTGEMTLQGKVLPVGGIKEKILAAKRLGITDIYLSERNRRHIEDIKADLLDGMRFHYINCYSDVLSCLSE